MKTSAALFEELLMSESLDNEKTISELMRKNESKTCLPRIFICGKSKKKKSKPKKKTRSKMGQIVLDGPGARDSAIDDIVGGLK